MVCFPPRAFLRYLIASRLAFATGLLLGASGVVVAQDDARVVAVGDIHGAGDALVAILQTAELLDETARWSGGSATLVQTGDFTDRGPQVKEVMNLLIRLEDEASAAGGRALVLLGNHETMNLTANVRDVTPAIFLAFAGPDAESRRQTAYRDYLAYLEDRHTELGRPFPGRQTRDEWMTAHPPGFFEYLDAFGPRGRYGRWLRDKPVAVVVGDTLFLHAGLAPGLEDAGVGDVGDLNDRVADEIRRFDEIRADLIEHEVILPFSTFDEMTTAVILELDAWMTRLSPGPPAPGRRRRTLSRAERERLDLLFDVQEMGGWLVIDPAGPIWFRGYGRWTPEEGESKMTPILEQFHVSRVVAGHNVTRTRRIQSRFGGRVFQIDTGMLASIYRGQASALELVGDRVTAIYRDERVDLSHLLENVVVDPGGAEAIVDRPGRGRPWRPTIPAP